MRYEEVASVCFQRPDSDGLAWGLGNEIFCNQIVEAPLHWSFLNPPKSWMASLRGRVCTSGQQSVGMSTKSRIVTWPIMVTRIEPYSHCGAWQRLRPRMRPKPKPCLNGCANCMSSPLLVGCTSAFNGFGVQRSQYERNTVLTKIRRGCGLINAVAKTPISLNEPC